MVPGAGATSTGAVPAVSGEALDGVGEVEAGALAVFVPALRPPPPPPRLEACPEAPLPEFFGFLDSAFAESCDKGSLDFSNSWIYLVAVSWDMHSVFSTHSTHRPEAFILARTEVRSSPILILSSLRRPRRISTFLVIFESHASSKLLIAATIAASPLPS